MSKSRKRPSRVDEMSQAQARAWLKSVGANHELFSEEKGKEWPRTYQYACMVYEVLQSDVPGIVDSNVQVAARRIGDRVYEVLHKCKKIGPKTMGADEYEQIAAAAVTQLLELGPMVATLVCTMELWEKFGRRSVATEFEVAFAQIAERVRQDLARVSEVLGVGVPATSKTKKARGKAPRAQLQALR